MSRQKLLLFVSGRAGGGSRKILKLFRDKKILGWALYDWANSAFATTVMAGFFPLFFKQYWSQGVDVNVSTYNLGLANSLEGLALALVAPLLGTLADQGGFKKLFLIIFMLLGVITTIALFWVPLGGWYSALVLFTISAFAFSASNIFYDALLINVAPSDKLDAVSGFGYAVGYLGGGLLFLLNVLMFLKFGPEGVLWSFVTVGLWWALFSIPLMKYVPESRPQKQNWPALLFNSWSQFFQTFKKARQFKSVFLFLLSYIFYIDGVNTIIKMAIDYGLSIGLESKDLILALLLVQFIGFPAAIGFGILGEKWSPRAGISLALGVYFFVTLLASRLTTAWEFYLMAALIGLVQGGVQSLSRSLFARLVPPDNAAEFFGLFNILGKFSAIIGPWLVGWVSLASGSSRLGILVIVVQFAIGALLLHRVKPQEEPILNNR